MFLAPTVPHALPYAFAPSGARLIGCLAKLRYRNALADVAALVTSCSPEFRKSFRNVCVASLAFNQVLLSAGWHQVAIRWHARQQPIWQA